MNSSNDYEGNYYMEDLKSLLANYKNDHDVNPIINAILCQIDDNAGDYSEEWRHFILDVIDSTIEWSNQNNSLSDSEVQLLNYCIDNAKSFGNITNNNIGSTNFYYSVIQKCHKAGILQSRHYLDMLNKSMSLNCYDVVIQLIFERLNSISRKEQKKLYIDCYKAIDGFIGSSDKNRKFEIGKCFFDKADKIQCDPFIFNLFLSNKIEKFRKQCLKYISKG